LHLSVLDPSTLPKPKESERAIQALDLLGKVEIGVNGKLRFLGVLGELENFIKVSGVLQKVKLTIEDETFHNVSVKWGDGYRRASTKIPHAVVVHGAVSKSNRYKKALRRGLVPRAEVKLSQP
jgi:hypothetical protein